MTIKKTFVAQHKPQVILEKSGSVWTSSDNEKCTPPCHLGKHIRGFSSISSHPHWWTAGASMATLEKASFGHAESKLNVLRILANISLEHMHMLLSHCSDQICDKKQLWWDFFPGLLFEWIQSCSFMEAGSIWQLLVYILVDKKQKRQEEWPGYIP